MIREQKYHEFASLTSIGGPDIQWGIVAPGKKFLLPDCITNFQEAASYISTCSLDAGGTWEVISRVGQEATIHRVVPQDALEFLTISQVNLGSGVTYGMGARGGDSVISLQGGMEVANNSVSTNLTNCLKTLFLSGWHLQHAIPVYGDPPEKVHLWRVRKK